MAFVLPFLGYGIFLLCKKLWKKHGDKVGAFLGGYIGIVVAALCCGIELGLQPMLFKDAAGNPMYCPYPLYIAVPAMVGAHLIIGFIEGGITLAVYSYIKKVAPQTIYNPKGEPIAVAQGGAAAAQAGAAASVSQAAGRRKWITAMWWIIGVAVVLSPLGLLASGDAWGEWGGADVLIWLRKYHLKAVLPQSFTRKQSYHAALDGYAIPGMDSGWQAAIGYILCAITAILIFIIVARIIGAMVGGKKAAVVTTAEAGPLAAAGSAVAPTAGSAAMPAVAPSEAHAGSSDIASSFLASSDSTKNEGVAKNDRN